MKRREVDEAAVEILDQHSEALEALDAADHRLGFPPELLLERGRLLRIEIASVAGDPGRDPRPARGRDRECAPARYELLRDRPHLVEQLVRFLRREVALRHPSIIARRVRR